MSLHRMGLVAAAVAGIAASTSLARAADPASVQTPVEGTDVMGDKGRSGPDGFSWAPQPRDQALADKQVASGGRGDPNSQPGSTAGKKLAPGDDPGTPAAPDSHGPGSIDTGSATRP